RLRLHTRARLVAVRHVRRNRGHRDRDRHPVIGIPGLVTERHLFLPVSGGRRSGDRRRTAGRRRARDRRRRLTRGRILGLLVVRFVLVLSLVVGVVGLRTGRRGLRAGRRRLGRRSGRRGVTRRRARRDRGETHARS